MKRYIKAEESIVSSGQIVDVDIDLDEECSLVEKVFIYTNVAASSSNNMSMATNLTVDDQEAFCKDFDTNLLHPAYGNNEFANVNLPTDKKRKLKVSLKDELSSFSAYTVTVLVVMSK